MLRKWKVLFLKCRFRIAVETNSIGSPLYSFILLRNTYLEFADEHTCTYLD